MWDLEAIYQAHPNMTFILTRRNPAAWLRSVTRELYYPNLMECENYWPEQPIHEPHEIKKPLYDGYDELLDLPDQAMNPSDLLLAYKWHQNYIHQFVKDHPSVTFVEVDLESNATGKALEEAIGIDARCWGHHHKTLSKAELEAQISKRQRPTAEGSGV